MDNLTLSYGSESITFDSSPFILQSCDASKIETIQSFCSSDGQRGRTLLSSRLDMRKLEIHGCVVASGATTALREEYLSARRRLLARVCDPTHEFTFSRGGRTITCVAEETPHYLTDAPFAQRYADCFTLKAICCSPCFEGEERIFTITDPTGSTVHNDGDTSVGMVITASFTAICSEFKFIGAGGKYLDVYYGFDTGDALEIDTRFGKKGLTLIRSGSRIDISNSLTASSAYPSAPAGGFTARCICTGNMPTVTVSLREQFFSL